jgi:3-oxoacyl-[acyl-carrier protein] reductase
MTGEHALALPLDLSRPDAISAALDTIVERWGPVEILVANAPGPPSGSVESIRVDQWQQALDMNLLSMVRVLHHVLPGMRARRWGRIVFITTVGVKVAQPNMVLSNATRLAVVGLAKTLALELGDAGILVNVVAPGPIQTDRMDELISQTAKRDGISLDEATKIWLAEVPFARMGQPSDVSSMVALLCSDASRYITGTVIPIDGGKSRGY